MAPPYLDTGDDYDDEEEIDFSGKEPPAHF